MTQAWYQTWFNSPFYHILYKSRDEAEAQKSIDHLLDVLRLPAHARILDLACGKGRHSRYLAGKGFQVTGVDLSERSIQHARQFESEQLEFYVHDMRKSFRINYFDAVFNLFTSFGYFDSEAENNAVLAHAASNLVAGGWMVLDYFNSPYIRGHLMNREVKTVDGIDFHLSKEITGRRVLKTIQFRAGGEDHVFTESVRLYELADFERMFEQNNLKIRFVFGDYQLNPYVRESSRRLIILAKK